MAGLRSNFPLRLQQILSGGRPVSPALKLESEPPANVKSFIDRVFDSPLHDISIPLSGFRWEYNKGNFHHWRPLFLHFDLYFKTYISSRKDLLLYDNILVEDSFPKQSVLQIMRVMQIILENCHNKSSFSGLEHFKLLLASTDPDIIIATLETLSALVKINLSKLHGSGKLISCGSLNSHLLSLSQGWGSKEEGLGLYSCIMENERNQSEGLNLFPSDVENENNATHCRLGSTVHFEFSTSAPVNSSLTTEKSKMSKLHAIKLSDLHLRKEDDLVILKECIEQFNVPQEHRFSLLTRIRYARAFRSPRMCRLFSRICILAFIVLVQSNDAHDELVSYFANEPEYTSELIRIVRCEESIPANIRALAMLALGSQLAACASSHERARILSGSSIISVGGNRMVLLGVLQKAISSLSNPSDPSSPLFVDALLQFFLLHVLSSSSSSSALRVSGMVPPLLPLLTNCDPAHMHLVSSAVKTLQKLMEYSSTAVSIFKDNGGIELLSERLRIEVDKIIGAVDEKSTAMVILIGDSLRHDDDYLYSQKKLIKMLLKALGSSAYSQGNSNRSQNTSNNSLPASLTLIFRNVNKFGGDIYFSAVTVMSEIIHKDPTCFYALDEAGLPDSFLSSVVSGILPVSKALVCVPSGLGAICLNSKGLEAVEETSALRFLVDIFTSRKFLVAMNEGVVLLANAVEELLRHVSSLRCTGVDIIIDIITTLSLGESRCADPTEKDENTAMETDSENEANEGHDLVSAMDLSVDGVSEEQFVQLSIFHVMVLVHRTMENSETCRLFVEKGGIDALLKLLLRPSITQSSEGMPIALHSTVVFKGFTQHHSIPLARAFCFSLREHLRKVLSGFKSVVGCLLSQGSAADREISSSLFVVEFLLFLAASKDNRWISTLLSEFGDSNKDVLENVGKLHREVLWQIALLEDSNLDKEFSSSSSSNEIQRADSSTSEFEEHRINSFRQYLDPLLRRRVSGWNIESQFSDLINIYRDLGRAAGNSRRTGSESHLASRFSSNPQPCIGNSSDASTSSKSEDEKQKSYYSSCRDMMRSLSYHVSLLFMELGKAMLLASRRESNTGVLPSSVMSVATTITSIMLDHLNFRGYAESSEVDVSVSTKCRYLGKVIDFVDGVLTDRPESCNPIMVSCLFSCGVIQAILTTFEATSQLPFTLNRVLASPMEMDDTRIKVHNEDGDSSWIYGPLLSYCMLMDHLVTSSFILSSSTKQLLDQPLTSGSVPYPQDAESFVKVLQSKVLKAVLPIWTHPHFSDCNMEFISAVLSIMKHVISGIEVRNASGTGPRTAGPLPDESVLAMIVEMGFSRARAEEAIRQAGSNSVEIATDWLFSHPEEPQEDAELARALAMSLVSSDTSTKEVEITDATDLDSGEETTQLPDADDFLSNCLKLLKAKESSAFAVRDLLLMICSQNDGQNRPKVLNFVIDHVKLYTSAPHANSPIISSLFHVLALILHEDAASREVSLKAGLIKISLIFLSDWDRNWDKNSSGDQKLVPKWVTACLLSIDRMLQVDPKLIPEAIECEQLKQNNSPAETLLINESRRQDFSPSGRLSRDLDRHDQKTLLEILCQCIKNQFCSETMHVVLQLCATLTKVHYVAVNFLEFGGLHALLSLPTSSLFSGFNTVATAIIRHILEDPHTLQQAMELEIRHSLITATNRHSNSRMTPRNFVQTLGLVIARDPVIFMQAAQAVCQIEMVGDRPYISLNKDREKEKTKDKEKIVEKEKQTAMESKITFGDVSTVASSYAHNKIQDSSTKPAKSHKKSTQSFTGVIEHLLDVLIAFIPSKVDNAFGSSLGNLSSEMDIDSSSVKGKGKAIALPLEESKANIVEANASLAKAVFVLKLLTEILLTYTSSIHVLLRRDAELSSSRSTQKVPPIGGIFYHFLHKFLPNMGIQKKDKKTDGDWRQKLTTRANQLLVAASIRSSEGRKRVFSEINNVFNDFADGAGVCKAPDSSLQCFIDLLNDILSARSPTGSHISPEASVTFIEVGLVHSLTRTLNIFDLDHPDSSKVVTGVVKALELVTKEYIHSADIDSLKGSIALNLASDQNQGNSSNSGADRFQPLETVLQHAHTTVAVEHIVPFDSAPTSRSSDDMDHEQDMDGSYAREAEDDFMHETSEDGGVLENGISTVEITFEIPHNAGDEDEDEDMSEDDDGEEVEDDEDEDDEDENNDLEEDDVQMMHPDADSGDHEIDEEYDEYVEEEEDDEDDGVILRLEEDVNGMNFFDHIEVFSGGNNFPSGTLLLGRRQEFAASMSNRLGRANDRGVNLEHPLLEEPSALLNHQRHSENVVDLAFSDRRHDNNSSRLDAIFRTLRNGRQGHRFSMWLDDSHNRSNSIVPSVPEGMEELVVSQLRRPTSNQPPNQDEPLPLPQDKDEPNQFLNSEPGAQVPAVQNENNGNMLTSSPVLQIDMSGNASNSSGATDINHEREPSGLNEHVSDMQYEHGDAVVRDVEAVSQASSGSGATLGESLRSLEVEIGSVDGHDDGERHGQSERIPMGDLQFISRTRRLSGSVMPGIGRDVLQDRVNEVPSRPQEADQNVLREESLHNRAPGSESIDPTFLEALPAELRAEVLSSRQDQIGQVSGDQSQAEGEIDPEFLAALPPDIREEVLAQQRTQRQSQAHELEGQPVEMDAVSIIATFPSEIREEVLLTSPDTLLATLTPALVAEANMLRERFAHRYHSSALFGMQSRSRRGEPSRRGDLVGSSADRNALDSSSRRSAVNKIIESAGAPLVDTNALKALVRLLRVVQPLYKGQFQRLLLNLCAHHNTRTSLVQILMDMLILDLRGCNDITVDDVDQPFRLFGCQSFIMYSRPQFSDGVPPLVSRRILETLTFLARNHQYVAKLLLHQEVSSLNASEMGASSQGHGKAVIVMEEDKSEGMSGNWNFSIVVLLRLLNLPLYMRSVAHLEQLLNLLEVIMIHAESDIVLPKQSVELSKQPLSLEGAMQVANNDTSSVQPSILDSSSAQANTSTIAEVRCFSKTDKELDPQAVLLGLPKAELQLLCSLLAREGLSDNAYVLVAEVLKRLVAVVPIFCLMFIIELAKSMRNLVASGMNELHINGDAEKALLSSSSCGTAILRVLQALSSLVFVLHDKKDLTHLSEKGFVNALSQVQDINASLESLWLELSSCISKIESSAESIADLDAITGNTASTSSGASSPLPANAQNILPYIESFFVTCEKLHPGHADVSQEFPAVTTADLEDASTSGQKMFGFSMKIDEKLNAFVKFSEKHKKLLNSFVRQNPSLLEKSFSLMLKVPRFIDFDNKRAHFRSKIKHQHDHHHPSMRVSVRRAYILEDSYNQLRMRPAQDLKSRLTVHFQGEEGIDAGGLTREWYQLLSRVIFDKGALLFTTVGNDSTFQPNPNSVYQTEHLSYFKFVGRVVGKALFDGQLLDVHFTRSFYKHILGVKVTYHDIEAIDPDYYKNLKWMLENDISEILDLTFTMDADEEKLILYEKAEVTDCELIPGGRNIRVTEENKHEYVDRVVEHRLTTAIRPQINAFLEGFNELISRDLISIFNDKELELLISGLPDIDLDDLRENTEYSGYSNASPIIQWFWEVLQGFSKEDKAQFLQFVTGTSKVPLEGFSALQGISGHQRFQIHKAYGSPNHLPSAHTCFNQLDLPDYPAKEQLQERLLLAIHEGNEGFGFG